MLLKKQIRFFHRLVIVGHNNAVVPCKGPGGGPGRNDTSSLPTGPTTATALLVIVSSLGRGNLVSGPFYVTRTSCPAHEPLLRSTITCCGRRGEGHSGMPGILPRASFSTHPRDDGAQRGGSGLTGSRLGLSAPGAQPSSARPRSAPRAPRTGRLRQRPAAAKATRGRERVAYKRKK